MRERCTSTRQVSSQGRRVPQIQKERALWRRMLIASVDLPCVDAFLDNLTPDGQEVTWLTPIQLNNELTLFKLDTGAQVTAITLIFKTGCKQRLLAGSPR